jgi:hypothetical protein
MPKTTGQSKSISFKLTPKERGLLLGSLIMDEYLEHRLKAIPPNEAHVPLEAGELINLYGWLNAPGNQSGDEQVQRQLDLICERARRLIPEDIED